MKKLTFLLIAAALIVATAAGCGETNNNGGGSTTPVSTPEESSSSDESSTPDESEDPDESSTPDESEEPDESSSPEESKDPDESTEESTAPEDDENKTATEKVLQAIKTVYGESYLPNVTIEQELLETQFGLSTDTYVEAAGEVPMISTNPDTVLVVKAVTGKEGDVKAALEAYRSKLINDSANYPMNLEKINAAKVESEGEYVAFLLVGANDDRANATADARTSFAEYQVNKAVTAFHDYFKS